ncbi:MAG: GNVR domain-containing protein [Pseudomonadota bacterium]
MPEKQQGQLELNPDQIMEILFRRRWLAILPCCLSLTVGLFLTFIQPRFYQATTSILVEAQSVPVGFVKSIVSSGINERIDTISQQIMSQSNLEKIIQQFGLFSGEKARTMYLEDKIKSLRQRIKVDLTRARGGTDAFAISFTGEDPQQVMQIANTLAAFFMDENLKVREAQAIGTSEFLDSELEKTRRKLEDTEQRLSSYRTKYMGGLPDELESNLRTLDRLQTQLTDKQTELRTIKNTISTIEAQTLENRAASDKADGVQPFLPGSPEEQTGLSTTQEKLIKAERYLEFLLMKYTESHPDVIKMQKNIVKLKQVMEQEAAQASTQPHSQDQTGSQDMVPPTVSHAGKTPVTRQQALQLKQLRYEVTIVEQDIQKLKKEMEVYEQRVEDTPKREQDLLSLNRDYGNIRDTYNSLLSRKLEAELALNMEKKQKGEQFRILDSARLPEKPITPNVIKLMIFSLATGLGLSGTAIFLLEFFNDAIRLDEDIEKALGLPILAAIPPLPRQGDVFRNRFGAVAFGCAALYAVSLLTFFLFMHMRGINKVIQMIHQHV